jgi:hypothetical protein
MRDPGIMVAVVMVLGLGAPATIAAQDQPRSASGAVATNGSADVSETQPIDPDAFGVSLERIQRAVSRVPAIRPDSTRLVFRVEIFSRKPTIDDILGPDWRKGPTPMGAMSHQEFLNLVTPQAVQGYAAFDNKQALTVAATSFALQWAMQKALDKLQEAKTERAKEAARKEVAEALAALKKARYEAGLPDK